jgi:hypothetical protein
LVVSVADDGAGGVEPSRGSCFHVLGWGGQLVCSTYLRFVVTRRHLFAEATHCILPPIKEKYQEIDRIGGRTLLSAPLRLLAAPLRLLQFVWRPLARHTAGRKAPLKASWPGVPALHASTSIRGALRSFRRGAGFVGSFLGPFVLTVAERQPQSLYYRLVVGEGGRGI